MKSLIFSIVLILSFSASANTKFVNCLAVDGNLSVKLSFSGDALDYVLPSQHAYLNIVTLGANVEHIEAGGKVYSELTGVEAGEAGELATSIVGTGPDGSVIQIFLQEAFVEVTRRLDEFHHRPVRPSP